MIQILHKSDSFSIGFTIFFILANVINFSLMIVSSLYQKYHVAVSPHFNFSSHQNPQYYE